MATLSIFFDVHCYILDAKYLNKWYPESSKTATLFTLRESRGYRIYFVVEGSTAPGGVASPSTPTIYGILDIENFIIKESNIHTVRNITNKVI